MALNFSCSETSSSTSLSTSFCSFSTDFSANLFVQRKVTNTEMGSKDHLEGRQNTFARECRKGKRRKRRRSQAGTHSYTARRLGKLSNRKAMEMEYPRFTLKVSFLEQRLARQ